MTPDCANCSGKGIIFGPTDEATGHRLSRECPQCLGFGFVRPRRIRELEAYRNVRTVGYRLPA